MSHTLQDHQKVSKGALKGDHDVAMNACVCVSVIVCWILESVWVSELQGKELRCFGGLTSPNILPALWNGKNGS